MRCLLLVISLSWVAPACDRDRIDESYWRERGAEAVTPLKQNLKRALVNGLEEGPVEAVAACQVRAPSLAKAAGSRLATVGRTSHKLRNPDNAPRPWMRPLLRAYLDHPDQMQPKVVVLDQDLVGYMEPIYLGPMCVTCHGTEIDPTVQARIDSLYPNDAATGFEPGHFRGVFWAELQRD
ncbi:MAG: DUF3365 domain-containing protein [Polyangiales bacterium]